MTPKDKIKMFDMATEFQLGNLQPSRRLTDRRVLIQARYQIDLTTSWVVLCDGQVFSKSGKWEYELMPSSRTDEFIERTRYTSLDEAWTAARNAISNAELIAAMEEL